MQAVVNAAHARAVEEEEERRDREGQGDQARPDPPTSLPRRVPGIAAGPKPSNGVPWTKLPAAPGRHLSDEDSESDTDPFLSRLTASGAVASPPTSKPSAQPNRATQANGTAQLDDAVKPDHARGRDHTLRRRDRRAAKRDRARADRERAEREAAERERAAQAERERAEQAAEAEWAERAAEAERAHAEHERAARADQAVAGHAEQAQRATPPDQAEPEQRTPLDGGEPDGSAQPDLVAPTVVDQPWRPLGLRKAPTRRRSRTVVLAVGAAALLAAGPLMLALSRHGGPKPTAAEVTRNEAAAWVAQQISNTDVVSCDVTMCLALKAHGVSVGNLLVLGGTARDITGSQVVVSTGAIRQLFGSHLGTVYAPTVLASFGSGKTRIEVRVVAQDGAAQYLSALQADLQERKSVGVELAGTSGITLSALARRQMTSGQVAGQMLIVILGLASRHPLDILAFGNSAQGASPGVPLRSVYLAESGGAATVRSMLAYLHQQKGYFRPARTETTRFGAQSALFIEFDAPSLLGLINGPNS